MSEEKVPYGVVMHLKILRSGHRQTTPVSFLQWYRSMKKLCSQTENTVVNFKGRVDKILNFIYLKLFVIK